MADFSAAILPHVFLGRLAGRPQLMVTVWLRPQRYMTVTVPASGSCYMARRRYQGRSPLTLADFFDVGMAGLERRAAEEAIKREREGWLPMLEKFAAHDDLDWRHRVLVESEVRRLRRLLGIKPTLDERRAQTRERVRRYRERQRSGGADGLCVAQ
jgi:hypothetical protein